MKKLLLLLIPLTLGMSSSPTVHCFTLEPPTTMDDGTELLQKDIKKYRMEVNGKEHHELLWPNNTICFWHKTSSVCVRFKTLDTKDRESANWSNRVCD